MDLKKLKINVSFSLKKPSYICRMYVNFKHKKQNYTLLWMHTHKVKG